MNEADWLEEQRMELQKEKRELQKNIQASCVFYKSQLEQSKSSEFSLCKDDKRAIALIFDAIVLTITSLDGKFLNKLAEIRKDLQDWIGNAER